MQLHIAYTVAIVSLISLDLIVFFLFVLHTLLSLVFHHHITVVDSGAVQSFSYVIQLIYLETLQQVVEDHVYVEDFW